MKNDYFINHYVRRYPENKIVRCDAVGFGAVLIKMDVIRRMKKPYFMSTCGTGEDVFFCYKAHREAGAKVYMDTSVKLTHLGAATLIDENYAKYFWKSSEGRDIEKEYSPFVKEKTESVPA